jgi:GNAT superfamily N-acetyltransferase
MPEVKIRPAVATDVNALMSIDHSCSSEYVWQMDIQRDEKQTTISFREIRLPRPVVVAYPRSVQALSESWSRRAGFLVALKEGVVVGYARMNDTAIPHTAWLTDVVVTPRYRRQGIAIALIMAAQAWAVNRKNNRLMLEMITKNAPAIRLAQKLGFEFCGYNVAYYETRDIALFFKHSVG